MMDVNQVSSKNSSSILREKNATAANLKRTADLPKNTAADLPKNTTDVPKNIAAAADPPKDTTAVPSKSDDTTSSSPSNTSSNPRKLYITFPNYYFILSRSYTHCYLHILIFTYFFVLQQENQEEPKEEEDIIF